MCHNLGAFRFNLKTPDNKKPQVSACGFLSYDLPLFTSEEIRDLQ